MSACLKLHRFTITFHVLYITHFILFIIYLVSESECSALGRSLKNSHYAAQIYYENSEIVNLQIELVLQMKK